MGGSVSERCLQLTTVSWSHVLNGLRCASATVAKSSTAQPKLMRRRSAAGGGTCTLDRRRRRFAADGVARPGALIRTDGPSTTNTRAATRVQRVRQQGESFGLEAQEEEISSKVEAAS